MKMKQQQLLLVVLQVKQVKVEHRQLQLLLLKMVPTVTYLNATSIAENANHININSYFSGATNADVTVALSTSGATEGTDYTDGSGNIDDIVISAGSTTGTVSFTHLMIQFMKMMGSNYSH